MKSARCAKVLLSVLILLLPMLTGCGTPPTTTPAPTPTPPPPTATPVPTEPPPTATPAALTGLEPGACPFNLPSGLIEGKTIECGYLVVPEDRSDANSPTIRLAVAVLHPSATPQPDPIVYLEGGPGGSALEFLYLTFSEQFQPLLEAGRDIILFDQRGVGLSEPTLDCPELRELGLELLDEEIDGRQIDDEEAIDLIKSTALACRQDLAEVAELPAYNTAASAADVNDLREAMGYDQVNLWGTSYGTWLAIEVMRRYPEGIRSVVLDSVYPPQRDLIAEAPANAARSIDLLFETCAADQACSAAFPDLRTVYLDTVERLNQEHAGFQVTNPLTGKSYDLVMTGDNLASLLFQFLYITSVIPSLPQILYEASQEDYATIAQLLGALLVSGEALSQGQQFSVLCQDEVAFSSPQDFETALTEHPELERAFSDSILGELGLRNVRRLAGGPGRQDADPGGDQRYPHAHHGRRVRSDYPAGLGRAGRRDVEEQLFLRVPRGGPRRQRFYGLPTGDDDRFLGRPGNGARRYLPCGHAGLEVRCAVSAGSGGVGAVHQRNDGDPRRGA